MYNLQNLLQNLDLYKKKSIQFIFNLNDPNLQLTKQFYQLNKKNCNFKMK